MPGSASGAEPGPYTGPGGMGVRIDGAAQGVRPNINFLTPAGLGPPGLVFSAADDPGNSRVNVPARIEGEVQLAPFFSGWNMLTTPVIDLFTSLNLALGQVSRIVVISEVITGPITQDAIFSVGTGAGPPNRDHYSFITTAFSAAGQIITLSPIENPRPTVGAATQLRARIETTPVATAYTVGVLVYGTVLTP